ncbi:argininosuccinate lyase [Thalassospira marina]|uniref:Argininosuccinate lyase n=1 Tax=Thalassospira marina TaxID=2048283 RepID=A0A2N3KMN6_9PROT|nr:argininosuccinate lyase [Thalassospira marina]
MVAHNPPHDSSVFPDPVYKDTVLGPLFDGARDHFASDFQRIDRAHLIMLCEQDILSQSQASQIAAALQAIETEIDPATLTYTGEVEDFFFLIEKELKARLGADLGGRLHTARSRNDIDHTLFKLQLRRRITSLLGQVLDLIDSTITKADAQKETLIVAYTHGQPAQPTSFAHYLSAMIEVLLRDAKRLLDALATVNLSPMGAAAITTSGFDIDRHRMAELLGFDAPLRNSYSCIAAIDYVSGTYGALELLFLHLGRPIQDFQFWSSFEVGQLYVPNALVQISSIMPQKRNPVPIEHMRLLASQTFGRARAMIEIMHNTPFTDMNDSEGETQAFGYQAFATASRVIALMTSFVSAIRINEDRVAENIRKSCITITELADDLVRNEGLSFREAHEIAAHVAKTIVAQNGDLVTDGYAPFCKAFADSTGRETAMDAKCFATVVSAAHFVAVRDRFGGPGETAIADAITSYRDDLAALRAALATANNDAAQADILLQTKFNALLGASA